jgi:hypothetical protein
MGEIYLPTLHWFENDNKFSGSSGALRFMLTPQGETIRAELWHGLYCYEKSEMELTEEFPLTQEGIEQIRAWLTEHR